jgi:hypothetical protein
MSTAIGKKKIDEIPLFGSRRLVRDGDSSFWILKKGTARPVRLTKNESMFINAALHVAGTVMERSDAS